MNTKKTFYIYKITNLSNGKVYVGQTNNISKRINNHKSNVYNKKSRDYNKPLYRDIRKIGLEKIEFSVLEEILDNTQRKLVDERERYYINYYNMIGETYNINSGGKGNPYKKNFKEKAESSKLFTLKEIENIQTMMIKGKKKKEIMDKYKKLSRSMFYNINSGLNFKNDKYNYPLHIYHEDKSAYLNEEEIKEVKKDISSGLSYSKISEKWNISKGLVSMANNGKIWADDNTVYPLFCKACNKEWNKKLINNIKKDLMCSDLTMKEIAQKYNKAYSTIKKINYGMTHRDNKLVYPLNATRKSK